MTVCSLPSLVPGPWSQVDVGVGVGDLSVPLGEDLDCVIPQAFGHLGLQGEEDLELAATGEGIQGLTGGRACFSAFTSGFLKTSVADLGTLEMSAVMHPTHFKIVRPVK